VVVRPLLCRYHGCELQIPVSPTNYFLVRNNGVFGFGCVAFIEVGSYRGLSSKIVGVLPSA
jgi:hypothetical protein